jgi:type I protein arginine methyltransferase
MTPWSFSPNQDIHAIMIQDRVRTSTYASFIFKTATVFRNAIVLDVGCGTGILSLFAARGGAKRVIAVDASDIACKAKDIVKDNGLEDIIRYIHNRAHPIQRASIVSRPYLFSLSVVQGKVEEITLPDGIKHVDVIVSEWMGYGLLYESMLDSVICARDRFLRPGGVMAPSQCRMMFGLCEASAIYKERVEYWSDVYGEQGHLFDEASPKTNGFALRIRFIDHGQRGIW